jgi:hypothetical protein
MQAVVMCFFLVSIFYTLAISEDAARQPRSSENEEGTNFPMASGSMLKMSS